MHLAVDITIQLTEKPLNELNKREIACLLRALELPQQELFCGAMPIADCSERTKIGQYYPA